MYYFLASSAIIVTLLLLLMLSVHLGFQAPRLRETGDPAALGMEFQTVSIPTVAGKRLFAWYLPVSGSTSTVIVLHGWGGNAELMLPVALPFHQAGMSVLLVDARNHGQSDSHSFSSMPRFAEDVGMAVDWVKKRPASNRSRIVLLGHSVGAGAVLLAASGRKDIAAVISISGFAHPEWMMRRYLRRLHLPRMLITWILHYVQWVIGYRFGDIAPVNTVCRVSCPVLLVHGKRDKTVPIKDSRAILQQCRMPHISLLEIEDAGHDSVEKIKDHGDQLISFLQHGGIPGE